MEIQGLKHVTIAGWGLRGISERQPVGHSVELPGISVTRDWNVTHKKHRRLGAQVQDRSSTTGNNRHTHSLHRPLV